MLKKREIKNIFITGFMGAGKSTVGLALSNALKWQFIDTDAVISEIEKMPVTDVFHKKGARYFSKQERICVTKVCERSHQVISLGGGTILDAKIRRVIKKNGYLLYLKVPEAILLKRLEKELGAFPQLPETKGAELGFQMHKLLIDREPFYEKTSEYVVEFRGQSVPDLVDEILEHLKLAGDK